MNILRPLREYFGIIAQMGRKRKKEWYVKTGDGNVYGPADVPSLVAWAEDGRIGPSSFLSKNRIDWTHAQLLPELGMDWLVEVNPGLILGPYNRKFLIMSHRAGNFPADARVFALHRGPIDEDPPQAVRAEFVPRAEARPASSVTRGIFCGHDRAKLIALEVAARRELAVAAERRNIRFLGRKT